MLTHEDKIIFAHTTPGLVPRAVGVINSGGLIIAPTDTLYGILASGFQHAAVEKIFRLKQRASNSPLPLMAADTAQVQKCAHMNKLALQLAANFWPGPLTLILPAREESVPAFLTAADGSIAVRVPDDGFCRELALQTQSPLTATSANLSGEPPAQHVSDLSQGILAGVDLVVDGGRCAHSTPSTILRLVGGTVRIVREGAISRNELIVRMGDIISDAEE